MALTAEQKSIVTSTVPLLETHGLEVTKVFYHNVLNDFPTLRSLFSLSAQITDRQAEALAHAIYAYAANINDLTPILPVVERINQRHASLDISAPQYVVVGTGLMKALIQVLGRDVFTVQVEDAWLAAYQQLADLMIKREDTIMDVQEAEVGGWKGWRKMRLARKVVESSEITSFYWVPVDGGALPVFSPGQYISIRVDVPVDVPGGQQIRQYSLSDAPPAPSKAHQSSTNGTACTNGNTLPSEYYRNSIKRELGDHPGLVSNVLHQTHEVGSTIEMSNPAGDFFLEPTATSSAPVVLISAGVGQTPLLSMLNSLTASSNSTSASDIPNDTTSNRAISYIHAARDSSTHAFHAHLQSLCTSTPTLKYVTFHSQPLPHEVQGTDYDFTGRLDLNQVDAEETLHLSNPRAEYFVCGPGVFMGAVAGWLRHHGIDKDRVKMEVFGVGNVEGRKSG